MITTTAALVLGGLSAGGSLISGLLGKKASTKAAEQQIAAAEKARAYQEPLYNQALQIAQQQASQGQARYAPYAQTGGQGLVALSSLLGLPAPQIPAETTIPPYAPPGAAPAPGAMGTHTMPPGASATGYAVPRGTAPGAMVMLKAPTGQTRAVPADQADYYLSRGATRA